MPSKIKFQIRFKGGPGSGHHGHRGRPGKVGGSLPSGGGASVLDVMTGDPSEWEPVEHPTNYAATAEFYRLPNGDKVVVKRGGRPVAEEDTYKISERLGYEDVVPPTTITEIDGEQVSVQLVVEGETLDDRYLAPFTSVGGSSLTSGVDIDETSFKKMVVIDLITGNPDRHTENVIVSPSGKVWAIDNDLAFWKSKTVDNQLNIANDLWNNYTGAKRPLKFTQSDFQPALDLMNDPDFQSHVRETYGDVELSRLVDRARSLKQYAEGISKSITLTLKGGPGSGHFGHRGRPGKRGGSTPSSSGTASRPAPQDGFSKVFHEGDVNYILQEVAMNEWTAEAFEKWGGRKTIPQENLTDDDFDELRELFDIGAFDTDGEVYFRTIAGEGAWKRTQQS